MVQAPACKRHHESSLSGLTCITHALLSKCHTLSPLCCRYYSDSSDTEVDGGSGSFDEQDA